jgi:hypothetical protein
LSTSSHGDASPSRSFFRILSTSTPSS